MKLTHKQEHIFIRLSKITVAAVYLLILVGGIVRSTGSGMGCPDWPKCFGNWVPPTSADQLPENYEEIYQQKRIDKNEKLAKYLKVAGFNKLAITIRNDESIFAETEFNKHKTWIEYINRLVGVAIGFLIFSTFIASIPYLKKDKTVFYIALFTLILVIFQGWLGSIVVSTNLLPWMVTVHMLPALLIVALLIYNIYRTSGYTSKTGQILKRGKVLWLLSTCLATVVIQIVLGTQVREAIDEIAASFNYTMRGQWISELGTVFYLHRSFSIIIMLLHFYLLYLLIKNSMKSGKVLNLSRILLLLVILEVLTGAVMAYFAIPAVFQPVHLLLAVLIFGVQFFLILLVRQSGKFSSKTII